MEPATAPSPDPALFDIPLDQLVESPHNPRKRFDPKKLQELADSMRGTNGNVTPITVRRIPVDEGSGNIYEVICGARRLRAACLIPLSHLSAVVREMPDEVAMEVMTIENLHRDDLHPLEAAEGYVALQETFKYDLKRIASRVGKSESYIAKHMELADLIPDAKRDYFDGKFVFSHALLVARLTPQDQVKALEYLYTDVYTDSTFKRQKVARPVGELKRWIEEKLMLKLKDAPWNKDDAALLPAAGPCNGCLMCTNTNPELFDDMGKEASCTDPACYHKKMSAFMKRQKDSIRELASGRDVIPISGFDLSYESRKKLPTRDKWKEVPKAKALGKNGGVIQGIEPAIVVEGKGLGKTLFVKIEPVKERAIDGPRHVKTEKQQKKEAENYRKMRIAQAFNDHLQRVAIDLAPAALHGEALTKALGLIMNMTYGPEFSEVVHKKFKIQDEEGAAKLSDDNAAKAINLLVLTEMDPETQKRVVGSWGLDVAATEKDFKALLESEPKCEVCKCSEHLPCENGCAWDAKLKKDGHNVCGNCTKEFEARQKKGAPAPEEKPEKKSKKKTAKK